MNNIKTKKTPPSIDKWLKEAKADPQAFQEGMYLIHNGVVRETPRAEVRHGIDDGSTVKGMEFSYDAEKVDQVIEQTYEMPGIFHVKVWINEGTLDLGDDIMMALVGGDIRPNVIDALQFLIGKLKNECVNEVELK